MILSANALHQLLISYPKTGKKIKLQSLVQEHEKLLVGLRKSSHVEKGSQYGHQNAKAKSPIDNKTQVN